MPAASTRPPARASRSGVVRRALAAAVTPLLLVTLAGSLLRAVLAGRPGGLSMLVQTHLPRSGVDQAVTAVLLNFRSYDTWLEMGVLLLAVMGVLTVARARDFTHVRLPPPADLPLTWAARLLVPAGTLAGVYLLGLGTRGPGGAFQAGAVLGAAGVLLRTAGARWVAALRAALLRGLLLAGFGLFLLVATVAGALEGTLFRYPEGWAGPLIVLVESAMALSIAVTLAALFAGSQVVALEPAGEDAPA